MCHQSFSIHDSADVTTAGNTANHQSIYTDVITTVDLMNHQSSIMPDWCHIITQQVNTTSTTNQSPSMTDWCYSCGSKQSTPHQTINLHPEHIAKNAAPLGSARLEGWWSDHPTPTIIFSHQSSNEAWTAIEKTRIDSTADDPINPSKSYIKHSISFPTNLYRRSVENTRE